MQICIYVPISCVLQRSNIICVPDLPIYVYEESVGILPLFIRSEWDRVCTEHNLFSVN